MLQNVAKKICHVLLTEATLLLIASQNPARRGILIPLQSEEACWLVVFMIDKIARSRSVGDPPPHRAEEADVDASRTRRSRII